MLTPKQIEMRRTGVTATDISAVCGLNPYRSAMAVYLDKIGRPLPVEPSEPMWWGNALEDLILHRYCLAVRGDSLRQGRLWGETLRSAEHDWVLGTPDAFWPTTDGRPLWGVELKTAFSAVQTRRWGGKAMPPVNGASEVQTAEECERVARANGDHIPEEYLIQAAWCMAVTGLDRWDVAVLLGGYRGLEFRIYRLERDAALEARLLEIGREFWFEHVERRVPPPPDGTRSARAALLALYPEETAPIVPATDAAHDIAVELKAAETEYTAAAAQRERLRQELMAEVAQAEGVEGYGFKATWKKNSRGHRQFRIHYRKGRKTS